MSIRILNLFSFYAIILMSHKIESEVIMDKTNRLLTLRLPNRLVNDLDHASDVLGITKSNIIKLAMYSAISGNVVFQQSSNQEDTKRTTLSVRQGIFEEWQKLSSSNNLSINSTVIQAINSFLDSYSKVLT